MAQASDIIEIDIPSGIQPKLKFVRSEDEISFDGEDARLAGRAHIAYVRQKLKEMMEKQDGLDHILNLPTLHGEPRRSVLPSKTKYGEFYSLGYQNVFQAVYDWDTDDRANIVYIREALLDPPTPNASPEKEAITTFLMIHGGKMKKVNKVIGLGLGRPGAQVFKIHSDEAKLDRFEQSYFQHLTLLHMATVLRVVQKTPAVDVFVQDPAYTDLCRSVLTNMAKKHGKGLTFEELEDPDGFLEMDDQTVVFHCFVGFDAGEISLACADADLAGLFGGRIEENHQDMLRGKVRCEVGDIRSLMWLTSDMKHEWRQGCEGLELVPREGMPWYGTKFPAHFYVKTKYEGSD